MASLFNREEKQYLDIACLCFERTIESLKKRGIVCLSVDELEAMLLTVNDILKDEAYKDV